MQCIGHTHSSLPKEKVHLSPKKKVIINYSVSEGVKNQNIVKKKTLCFSSFTLSLEGMSKACLEAQYLIVRNREGEFPTAP